MGFDAQSTRARYALAVGASLLALGVVYAFFESHTPFLPCIATVMLISWRLGRGPGILAAAIFIAFTAFELFAASTAQNTADLSRDIARECMFAGVCALVIVISSAQHSAEKCTRDQADWLRFALANISNGVIGADANGKITYINPMAQRLTGYGNEALGKPCSEIVKTVSLDSKKELEDPLTKALASGGSDAISARLDRAVILISRDGRRYIIEDSATALPAPGGSPGHAVLVFRDVTEQRRIETELRSAADRYRLALEVGKLLPWEWNLSSDEFMSNGLKDLLPGMDVSTRDAFLKNIHRDDIESVRSIANASISQRTNYSVQYRLIRPTGEVIWIQSNGQPFFNERGEATKLVGVMRDMTEQKLVEKIIRDGQEQFRNVAESASDGFVTVDEKGKILYANSSFAELFGYQRAELIGFNLLALVPERLRARHTKGMERFLTTGVKTVNWRQVEFPALRKDGSEIAIEMSYSETRAGEKRLLSAIVRDVSQRKKDADAMQTARQRLELAQRIAGLGLFEWHFRESRSSISPELEVMFGMQPGNFAGTYESWEKIVHPDDLDVVRDNARRMMTEDLPEYSSVYRVIWPDKSVHWMSSKTKMFRDENGQPLWALGVILDITREKEAEVERERLLLNEKTARERLSLANRIAGIGTYELDLPEGKATMSLESGLLYGLEPGHLLRNREEWKQRVHPGDVEREERYFKSIFESHAVEFHSEYRVIWPDKSIHWLTTKGKIFYDENGQAFKMLGAEQDITLQKEAAAERDRMLADALAARVRMELAHRIAGIGTFEWDAITGETHFSPELETLYGLQPGEFRQTFEHWTKLVHPDDWPHVQANAQRTLKSTSNDYAVEFRVIWPDGSTHWITTKGKLHRNEHGNPLRLVGVEQDVTRQKFEAAEREKLLASEKRIRERLELAQRAARIGIHERNIRSGVIQCSPEWVKLMGLPSEISSCTYDDWIARIHPEDRETLSRNFIETGASSSDYYIEYRVVWPDETIRWLASSGRVLCDASRQPELSIGATVDITERKALDAQRESIIDREKAARTEAERTNQLKDEFLATVSHELRTPLTAIIGWAQLLNDGPVEPDMMRRGLESIVRNSRAQAQLVEDLLDVSRIVTGQLRIHIQPSDLSDVVSAAVDGIRPAAQAKKVSLVLNLNPARVSADADRLQQVAFNVLFNAVKFSNIGGRIEVSVQATDDIVQLTVKDNGKGIAPAFLPLLFERFTQEDGSSTRRYGGMGLGLAIAKHLVELHGGSIRATSDGEGKGTTMTIELPTLRRGDSMIFNRSMVPGNRLEKHGASDSAML